MPIAPRSAEEYRGSTQGVYTSVHPRCSRTGILEGSTMRLSAVGLMLILALGLLWAALVVAAQQPGKVYRIGFLGAGSPSPLSVPTPMRQALWQRLHELGWIAGQNIVIERRLAMGQF